MQINFVCEEAHRLQQKVHPEVQFKQRTMEHFLLCRPSHSVLDLIACLVSAEQNQEHWWTVLQGQLFEQLKESQDNKIIDEMNRI